MFHEFKYEFRCTKVPDDGDAKVPACSYDTPSSAQQCTPSAAPAEAVLPNGRDSRGGAVSGGTIAEAMAAAAPVAACSSPADVTLPPPRRSQPRRLLQWPRPRPCYQMEAMVAAQAVAGLSAAARQLH